MLVLGEAKECKVGSMIVDVEVPKWMSPHPTNSMDDHISVIEKKEEQIDLFVVQFEMKEKDAMTGKLQKELAMVKDECKNLRQSRLFTTSPRRLTK